MTIDVNALAAELTEARLAARPAPFIAERHPELDWPTARAIAVATDALRREAGEQQVGWKLGWTSSAMREALGIDQPNWGTLWGSQVVHGALDLLRFIAPKIEPELVWTAPDDLGGTDCSADQLRARGGDWALGLEVVDPRYPSFAFTALDNTADNSSGAAVAVGRATDLDPDLVDDVKIVFSDGADQREGRAEMAMGSPWEAIAWLVRSLAAEGLSVRKGDIVFTGGLAAPFDVEAGAHYHLSGTGLERVQLQIRQ